MNKRNSNWRDWIITFIILSSLFVVFHPLPSFQWASYKNDIKSYESFLKDYPNSDYSDSARERIRILKEPQVWITAQSSNDIRELRKYVRTYPNGKHLLQARTKILTIADSKWDELKNSISDIEINRFINSYPESSKLVEAKKRIQNLYNNFGWVKSKDKLEHYVRFINRFPAHPQKEWIEKRIIDLEVQDIASGEYGEIPPLQQVSSSGSIVKIEIENQTGYSLTIRYSGFRSKKITIPQGEVGKLSLPPGKYRIAASVPVSYVVDYYGEETLKNGTYSSNYYIQRY